MLSFISYLVMVSLLSNRAVAKTVVILCLLIGILFLSPKKSNLERSLPNRTLAFPWWVKRGPFKSGIRMHAVNPSTQETGGRRFLLIWGQPGLHIIFQAQSYIVGPCPSPTKTFPTFCRHTTLNSPAKSAHDSVWHIANNPGSPRTLVISLKQYS